MNSIQVKNLRSLTDTGKIDVKKINILVGTNSSGKSTFLRIFPLLKQSFNKKINGPILWCGDDDDYVDFGSFEEAVNYGISDKCIKLLFEVNVNIESDAYLYKIISGENKKENFKLEVSIRNNQDSGYDFIAQITILFRDNIVIVDFSEENKIKTVSINQNKININEDIKDDRFYLFYYDRCLFDISLFPLREYAGKKIRAVFNIKEEKEDVNKITEDYIRYIDLCIIQNKSIKWKDFEKIKTDVENLSSNKLDEVKELVIMYQLPLYFRIISNYIQSYFRNVYYIAPVRATAERYYRLRNAAVNEVDCRGKNLPVFLNSLSNKKFIQFQNWTKENLGFEVIKTTSEGHVSLKVRRKNQEKAVNLSDTGFGYSQILPIVTQLWYIEKEAEEKKLIFRTKQNDIPTTMVIEQPELHLHPGLQAKLIDIIAKVAKNGNVNFIIETHSETMINRMGRIISTGGISNNDVGITIFEKGIEDNNTLVKQGGYDEEGYLKDWPVGFFEPEEE